MKYQLVHISRDFTAFGHGRHAWYVPLVPPLSLRMDREGADARSDISPGRFFAAMKLKTIVAYLVLNYDVKVPGDGGRPADMFFGSNVLPHPSAKIMLRQRQHE